MPLLPTGLSTGRGEKTGSQQFPRHFFYYISIWYKGDMMTVAICLFWSGGSISSIFSDWDFQWTVWLVDLFIRCLLWGPCRRTQLGCCRRNSNQCILLFSYFIIGGKIKVTFFGISCQVFLFRQAHVYITAGACLSLGFRFAGSENMAAFNCLVSGLVVCKTCRVGKHADPGCFAENPRESQFSFCLTDFPVSMAVGLAMKSQCQHILKAVKVVGCRFGMCRTLDWDADICYSLLICLLSKSCILNSSF